MTNDDPQHDGSPPGLGMPIVVCQPDGPYDGRSFVAGLECGTIAAALPILKPLGAVLERWVAPELVPQLDLLAMHSGFKLTAEPWDEHPDEWVKVTFEPAMTEG